MDDRTNVMSVRTYLLGGQTVMLSVWIAYEGRFPNPTKVWVQDLLRNSSFVIAYCDKFFVICPSKKAQPLEMASTVHLQYTFSQTTCLLLRRTPISRLALRGVRDVRPNARIWATEFPPAANIKQQPFSTRQVFCAHVMSEMCQRAFCKKNKRDAHSLLTHQGDLRTQRREAGELKIKLASREAKHRVLRDSRSSSSSSSGV